MIQTSTHEHNVRNPHYVKVYYTDNYTILEKFFTDTSSALPFIEKLKKNPDFHFIVAKSVYESKVHL